MGVGWLVMLAAVTVATSYHKCESFSHEFEPQVTLIQIILIVERALRTFTKRVAIKSFDKSLVICKEN